MSEPPMHVSFVAGAAAGFAVDVILYPMDTIKTRLQSSAGFFRAGGFRGLYQGMSAVVIGAAPSSALFFVSYEAAKAALIRAAPPAPSRGDGDRAVIGADVAASVAAASLGEVVACVVRVPTEIVKVQMQTGRHASVVATLTHILKQEGVVGMSSGYAATLAREVPFSAIQFPLYEQLKRGWADRQRLASADALAPWEGALCGSAAGAVAAALTTPLDVAKTTIMLRAGTAGGAGGAGGGAASRRLLPTLAELWREGGPRRLFAGVVPRTVMMGLGGLVYIGAYETAKKAMVGCDDPS